MISGTAMFNPAVNKFKLGSVPSSSGTISYTKLDFSSALSAVAEYNGDIDFVVPLKERSSVVSSVLGTLNNMASERKLVLGLAGAPTPVDTANFENSYDDSRLQLTAPVRHADYTSMIGAFAGMRANIGLTTTPLNQRLVLRDARAVRSTRQSVVLLSLQMSRRWRQLGRARVLQMI